ncbi:MAG: hypothetical protein ACJAWG_002696 [Candidatus Azotimanducaceae bacterium]|jgi:hypothetical protein
MSNVRSQSVRQLSDEQLCILRHGVSIFYKSQLSLLKILLVRLPIVRLAVMHTIVVHIQT